MADSDETPSFDDRPNPEQLALLRRYRPRLHYDSQATFFAVSAATMTDNPSNRLMRKRAVLASASGVPHLTLDLLSRHAAAHATRNVRQHRARRREVEVGRKVDRIDPGPERLYDANEMQANPDYVHVAYGRVCGLQNRLFLQYWLWFYGTPSSTWLTRDFVSDGAWHVIQVELQDEAPRRVVTDCGDARLWKDVDRVGRHPVVYVAPFSNQLYLDQGVQWRGYGWDGGDGQGASAPPRLATFDWWARWPGRWGPAEYSPQSPAATPAWRRPESLATKSRVAATTELDLAPRDLRGTVGHWARVSLRERLTRWKHQEPPGALSIDARLERGRIAVEYKVAGTGAPRPRALWITIHSEGCVVAHSRITEVAGFGEEYLDLHTESDSCDVRVSALTSGGNRRCATLTTVEAHKPDPLELAIFHAGIRRQLREPEVDTYRKRLSVSKGALEAAIKEREAIVWRAVAAELQAFREARAAIARRRLAVTRSGRAIRLLIAWVLSIPLIGAATWQLSRLDPTLAGVAFGWIIYVPLWFGGRSLMKLRDARRELRRWPDLISQTEHAPLTSARTVFERALLEKGIAPLIRQRLNETTTGRYGETLYFAGEGLSQLRVPEHEIETRAKAFLNDLTGGMRGGSIGIGGVRGVGKSTLIDAYCKPRSATDQRITVVLAAPVQYDAREFVLALFGALCEKVLGGETPPPLARHKWQRTAIISALLVAAVLAGWGAEKTTADIGGRYVLVGVGLLAMGSAAALIFRPRRREFCTAAVASLVAAILVALTVELRLDPVERWAMGFAGGIACLLAIGLAYRAFSHPAPQEQVSIQEDLRREAARSLRDIRFQQSWSEGYSGKLSLPFGTDFQKDVREDISQQQATFPEIVQRLRSFIARIVKARGGVVVGIDEMDKMESGDTAKRFLNEIKAIFGIERCFYLVSISENAMSSFERRGLPFRDVFDSSFDEIVSLEPLQLTKTADLLRGRVVGLAPEYIDLCHCLSGGLPRDVLRVVRLLAPFSDRGLDAAAIAREVVAAELGRKVEAVTVSARDLALEPHVGELLFWLNGLRDCAVEPVTLIQLAGNPPPNWPRDMPKGDKDAADNVELCRLRLELAAYAYYLATVLQLFTAVEDPAAHFTALEDEAGGESALDVLAQAQKAFAVNPRLAVARIDAFRAAHLGPPSPVQGLTMDQRLWSTRL